MRLLQYARTFNPRWVISLLVLVVVILNLNHEKWKRSEVISHDVIHYYAYLPAVFYENDLSLSFLEADSSAAHRYWPVQAPNGNKVIKCTMGMAVSYLPFFAAAHAWAKLSGAPADGFSAPYQLAVQMSSLIYFVIGLIFLAKLLRLHFPGFVSSITLLTICFGTNALFYLSTGGGMSHAVSFMLCVLYFYQVIAWHQLHDRASALQMGLLLGALCLVRPVNILLVLVFVLYDVRRWREVKARARLFARKWAQLCLITLCVLAVMLPQLLYWKWITGDFLFFSYTGEAFHFARPHVIEGLFSFRKGWLVYTPVMVFAVAGFFFLRGYLRMYAWAVPVTFVVYVYVIFSWWCWWYGGSFGQRAMIDIYPILSVPLAAFIYKLRRLGGWYRRGLFITLGLLIALNLLQTWQAKSNIIHYDSMTAKRYAKSFMKVHSDHGDSLHLSRPDYERALKEGR